MAIRTREELLNAVRERIGDDTSDEALAFIEDVQDTINNYENNTNNDGTDWKKKYEDNDKDWRTKYRDRFFHGGVEQDDDLPDPQPKRLTFDELFKEG
jgi:hypothetical protein